MGFILVESQYLFETWKTIVTSIRLAKTYLVFQLRNKQTLVGTIFFSIFLIFLFTLAFPSTLEPSSSLYSGIFWIASFFSGNLILTNQSHLQSGKFQQGLLLTGVDAFHLYFGKFLSSLLYMLFMQTIILICMMFFFPAPTSVSFLHLILCTTLGSIGFLSLGTLFFSLAEFQNIKDLLITVLFYPLVIPLFIFVNKAGVLILDSKTPDVLYFVLGYDCIFVFLSALLYEFVIEDSL